MTTPTQAITADLGLDYNYARVVFIDPWDEALRAPVYQQKEWTGEGGAPVRFETSFVGLSIATNYPSVTVQVWAAEPPLSRQNPANELWVAGSTARSTPPIERVSSTRFWTETPLTR